MIDILTNPIVIWVALAVIFAIVEALTMGLTTIWFAIGAIIAALVAMTDMNIIVQIIVFLVVSIVLLILTRPIAKKRINSKVEKTNINALIGKTAIVTGDIEEDRVGQVKVNGQVWSAIMEDGEKAAPKDSKVLIKEIKGVKLVVSKME